MKLRILCFATVLLLAPAAAFAQDQNPDAGVRLEQLQQRLNLTEEQRSQIRPILTDEVAKLAEIRAKYPGDTSRRSRRKMLRELQDVQKSLEKRVQAILTKEQMAEWKKLREERRKDLREQAR